MFSILSTNQNQNSINNTHVYVCLSTDSKPTGVANGSVCLEMNTSKIYLYDAAGSTWREWE